MTEAEPETAGLLERRFELGARGSNLRTEILAGVTTFLTMAYIVLVNPAILGQAGMPVAAVAAATCLAAGFASHPDGLHGQRAARAGAGHGAQRLAKSPDHIETAELLALARAICRPPHFYPDVSISSPLDTCRAASHSDRPGSAGGTSRFAKKSATDTRCFSFPVQSVLQNRIRSGAAAPASFQFCLALFSAGNAGVRCV